MAEEALHAAPSRSNIEVYMTAALWQRAYVAAAFALHPLHVESVAWVAERKDVLSTIFWLLTMTAYLRYARAGRFGEAAATAQKALDLATAQRNDKLADSIRLQLEMYKQGKSLKWLGHPCLWHGLALTGQ